MLFMRAMVIASKGVLELRDVPLPEPSVSQVRVRIRACALNRADLLQRIGLYPAPADAPQDIPGMEIAGVVDAVGPGTQLFREGDRVFGIVSGGAYAEAVVVHERTLARIPDNIDFEDAASLPEAYLTAYDAMVLQGGLAAGETVLVHAVGSGVGTAAVQIARAIGARSIGTSRQAAKLARAAALGMSFGIQPSSAADGAPRFADQVRDATEGKGADLVLELVGGSYVPESLASLADRGRLLLVGLVGGPRADVDLASVLRRRLRVFGTVLRARPLEEKIALARVLERNLAPLFASASLTPVVERVVPLEEANEALDRMAKDEGFGKTVLRVS